MKITPRSYYRSFVDLISSNAQKLKAKVLFVLASSALAVEAPNTESIADKLLQILEGCNAVILQLCHFFF